MRPSPPSTWNGATDSHCCALLCLPSLGPSRLPCIADSIVAYCAAACKAKLCDLRRYTSFSSRLYFTMQSHRPLINSTMTRHATISFLFLYDAAPEHGIICHMRPYCIKRVCTCQSLEVASQGPAIRNLLHWYLLLSSTDRASKTGLNGMDFDQTL